jgi:uroporphyrinogen decarboxylase
VTNKERALAVLNYKNYDRLPIVHFGYWDETLVKWANEGHIDIEDAKSWADGTPVCKKISEKLGFDFAWYNCFMHFGLLYPTFESEVLKEYPDGSKEFFNPDGVVVLDKDDAGSIPAEISHSLTDRKSWEELYKPKLQFNPERVERALVNTGSEYLPFNQGGLEFLRNESRENPVGLMVGSLLGRIRDWLGIVGLSYMQIDAPSLLDDIIQTVSDLCYKRTEYVLKTGAKFDFAHYWEDVCFKNGPLISPRFFDGKIGLQYKRITELLHSYGIGIISVDCDGLIDSLIPTWFNNGVNTMFPIEVGTWDANIKPWREKYGKQLRGVGGMRKYTFALDKKAVDDEIERLKPLVELGGYIPCPDHRIAPDAEWDNVRYYCDRMREVF